MSLSHPEVQEQPSEKKYYVLDHKADLSSICLDTAIPYIPHALHRYQNDGLLVVIHDKIVAHDLQQDKRRWREDYTFQEQHTRFQHQRRYTQIPSPEKQNVTLKKLWNSCRAESSQLNHNHTLFVLRRDDYFQPFAFLVRTVFQ